MARPILLHSYLLVCLFCLVSSAAATLALPPFLLRQSALERVQCQRVLNREVVFCSRGREIDVRGDKNMEEHDAKYPNNPQVYTITKARPKSAWEGRPAHGRFLDARTDFALFFFGTFVFENCRSRVRFGIPENRTGCRNQRCASTWALCTSKTMFLFAPPPKKTRTQIDSYMEKESLLDALNR